MKPTVFVILTPGFPSHEEDSTCLPFLQGFVKEWRQQSAQPEIIVISFQYPFYKGTYHWHGVTIISLGGKNKGGISRLWLWQKVKQQLSALCSSYTIQGILAFWCGECTLAGKQFANKHGIPFASWILGQDAKKNNHYVKRAAPASDELIALSDFTRDEFEKNHGIRPAQVIPPGIDATEFLKPATIKTIDILGAGSLIPLKQYTVFIEVVARIKEIHPDIRVLLCGKGPEQPLLNSLINDYRLEENVQLTDEVPHAELLQLMQQAKVFLHTSAYEGFGMVCIEALYAGTPVISFVKPMKEKIPNWYIAADTEDMVQQTLLLLERTPSGQYLFRSISDTVKEVKQLFARQLVDDLPEIIGHGSG